VYLLVNFLKHYYYDYDCSSTALLLLMNPHIPQTMVLRAPVISIIIRKENASLPAMFNLLHSSTNQQLFKKNFCNQSSHYENYGQFLLWMEAITAYHKIDTFCGELRWMVHKGGHWYVHEKCIAVWQKAPLGLKRCQTAKIIKPIALGIVKLRESEGIRQGGRQLVSRKFH